MRAFTWAAVAESISYLLLIAAVVAKHGFGHPAGVEVMGPVHGLLFLAYCAAVVALVDQHALGWQRGAWLVAAALVPLGGLLADRRVRAAHRPVR